MQKHDTSPLGTSSNYMNNYIESELDRGLTLKYLGEINGKLGIGTKKLKVNLKDEFNKMNKINKNLFENNNYINSRDSIRKVQFRNKIKLKQPLPDIKNEKIIIISDKKEVDKNKPSSIIFKKSKELPKSLIEHKLNKIDVYGNLLENINFEVGGGGRSDKILSNDKMNPKNENSKLSKNSINKPFIPSCYNKKERVLSASEKFDPERYRKKKVNLDEILQHHNSMHRKEMMSDKISLRHMKRSIDLIGNFKHEYSYSKKLDSKLVSSIYIINFKNM
jgi:hypothetical protein